MLSELKGILYVNTHGQGFLYIFCASAQICACFNVVLQCPELPLYVTSERQLKKKKKIYGQRKVVPPKKDFNFKIHGQTT
jgi:hypothetical protein